MKSLKNIIILFSIFLTGILCFSGCDDQNSNTDDYTLNQISNMKLTSNAFKHEASIPAKYTCDGDNVNPPLEISDIPEGTVSLALISDDPDAPNGTWVHWIIWDIEPNTMEILEGSPPVGAIEGITSFENNEYGGPCPPSGTHRYYFKLYALDTKLTLPPSTNKDALEAAMKDHIIGQTELMGTYSR